MRLDKSGLTDMWKRRRERGSTMVEFALVVILLVTLMLGVVEFGRALYAYHFVASSARRAARWAAVNGSTCSSDNSCVGTYGMSSGYASATDIETYATDLAPMGIQDSNVTVFASWPLAGTTPPSTSQCATYPTAPGCNCYSSTIGSSDTDGNSPGCSVKVTVNYDFHFMFPLVRSGSITLSSTSESIITH